MNEKTLSIKDKALAFNIFLILAAIFISSLVVSNLIFQKFFSWNFLGWYNFEISVGILPYPMTFLVTDLISEIYGKKKANQVVITGIFASAFSLLIIMLSDAATATEWSPIGNEVFHSVFGLSALAVFASTSDTFPDWLATGQALSSVLLTLTAAGATASYLNPPVELEELRPRLQELVQCKGTPQLLMRFGYGPSVAPTVRRDVDEVLIH